MFDRLNGMAEQIKSELVMFAQKLIQTPSISHAEKGVADLLLSEMAKLGYDECFRDDMGNIVGIVRGTEPGPCIMFNSHMDHVDPGDPGNWEGYDPYGGEIDVIEIDNQDKTGKEMAECIHGRAASDVKSGAACQVYAGGVIAKLKREGEKICGDFMFTGVVAEEPAEMVGMSHLCSKTLPAKGLKYDAMVSSEATSLKLYTGHRGRIEFYITVNGRTSHGSAPWLGINAIYKAIPLIDRLKGELYESLPMDDLLGKSSISLNIIECKPGALSIVPDKCMLSIDRRTIPGETTELALKQIQDIIDDLAARDADFKAEVKVKNALERSYTGVEYDVAKDMKPWKMPKEHPFTQACVNALEKIGQEVKWGRWDFATDGSFTAGVERKPTIGYSPMQEQFAHTPYDKVRTDYMIKALAGYVAIFLEAGGLPEDGFAKIEW